MKVAAKNRNRSNSLSAPASKPESPVLGQAQRPRSNSLSQPALKPAPAPASDSFKMVGPPSISVKIQSDRYKRGQQIGTGGQAKVHSLDPIGSLSQPNLVVKTSTGFPAQTNKWTEAEAQTLQSLQPHQNIVKGGQVATVGPKQKGLVMERLNGGTLEQARQDLKDMRKKNEISEKEYHGTKQFLVKGTVQGVDHMHQKGLLHNDLKTDNVMISSSPKDPKQVQPKLVDFGLATPTGQQKKQVGHKSFAAPETKSGPVTEKNDVYAIGATTYSLTKLKAGELPQPSTTPQLKTPAKGSSEVLQVKKDRNDFIQKTMAQDPNTRPTTQQALQHDYLQRPLLSDDEAQKVLQKMIDRRSPKQ